MSTEPAAAGIRIYNGKYADGAETFVLYATDAQDRDLTDLPMGRVRLDAGLR